MARSITHFSHPHDLVLQPSTKLAPVNGATCSFCHTGARTGKEVYVCSSSNCAGYILDPTCASLKKQELIPAHKQHVLDLITAFPAPGTIACKACGGWIVNNRYSCRDGNTCGYDVHAWCAKVPEKLNSKFHEHTLYLHFPGPQRDGSHGFRCGQCGQGDQGLWGYTCKVCDDGFFLHLDCNVFLPPPPTFSRSRGIHIFHKIEKKNDDGNDNNNKLAQEKEETHDHHHHHTKKMVAGAGTLMRKAGKIFKNRGKNQNEEQGAAEETEAAEETGEMEAAEVTGEMEVAEEAEFGLDEDAASGIAELFGTVLEFLGSLGE